MMHTSARTERIRRKLSDDNIMAFYVASVANRMYLTGLTGTAGTALITQNERHLLTDFRYIEQAERQAPEWTLTKVSQGGFEELQELTSRLGVKTIAFEADQTTVSTITMLEEALPNVRWIPVEGWVEEGRAIKDDDELRLMKKAVDVADRAFELILPRIVGKTEREIALELETIMRNEGADAIAFPSIVASGENSALPHAMPTDRTVTRGDFVTLDFGAVVSGYCSDMTRTVVIGTPSARQRDIYALVLKAQQIGIEAIRPGKTGQEVDGEARAVIEQAGFGDCFGHGLGHGIGIDVHESPPRLSKKGKWELKTGMVTSVEPGVYVTGWGGVRIEDLVVVTDDGCRILTRSPKELIEL